MPILVPPISIANEYRVYWVDPNNVTRDLNKATSPNLYAVGGAIGLGMPVIDIQTDKFPYSPGSFVRQINIEEREPELPIYVREDSFGDLLLTLEDLAGWFDTGDEANKRPGYLRVIRPDDSVRQILCYCRGMEMVNESGATWAQIVMQLLAPDPFPTAQTEETVIKNVTEAVAGFGVNNLGTKNAYPIWTLAGPFTDVSIRLLNTSELIDLTVTVALGEWLVVDTRPSELRDGYTIYDQVGANKISVVEPESVFWHLIPGVNSIEFVYGSGTTANTHVILEYLPRYRTLALPR